ncbi:hypothetical protein J2067_004150 [Erwinia rhapontici]|nr:hypothetical protein [Erwinia rhapontici]
MTVPCQCFYEKEDVAQDNIYRVTPLIYPQPWIV